MTNVLLIERSFQNENEKKILIISIVLAIMEIIVYYLHEDTVVFKINYGVSIPQSIEYNYILPGDGYADLPMYNQLVFRKQFTQKHLSSFKKIDQNNKEKLIQLIEVYYNNRVVRKLRICYNYIAEYR